MNNRRRELAIVTGASSGIGYELATCCARHGYDLLIAADSDELDQAAEDFRGIGATVQALKVDLSTAEGVDKLYDATKGRPVAALLANAGNGLGHAFLDQDFDEARRVLDTNVTGTIYLLHRVARDMRMRRAGRILITSSIAGFVPGSFQAVYNGSKAFVDSFSSALRNELKGSGVTVSCLMPGATDTEFFARADMLYTKVGQDNKADPAEVAKVGFEAMLNGEGRVIAGLKNTMQAPMAHVMAPDALAEMHQGMAQPGSGTALRA
jgi:short-subunit dehydrogenase